MYLFGDPGSNIIASQYIFFFMALNGRKEKANQKKLFIYLSGNSLIFNGGSIFIENGVLELP